MLTYHLYERKTHHYVDTYRHLDREDYVATVKMTTPRQVREGNGLDDGGTYLALVRAPAGAPNLRRALTDTLTHWGCHHEYDCCGCRLQRASVKKLSARDYLVRLSIGYNY